MPNEFALFSAPRNDEMQRFPSLRAKRSNLSHFGRVCTSSFLSMRAAPNKKKERLRHSLSRMGERKLLFSFKSIGYNLVPY